MKTRKTKHKGDTISKSRRSAIMARVKGKDTKPEMRVRRIVFALGARYRLHAADLAGRPDIVLRARRKIIFVHGCFWHGHDCRAGRNTPGSNKSYWDQKLARNKARDAANMKSLRRSGWKILVVWECETRNEAALRRRLSAFLKAKSPSPGKGGA